MKAVGAFSGGLDSQLAAITLASQGVEVHLVTFSSPFFSSEKGRLAAGRLGMPWRELDFTETIMGLVTDPPSGLGRNCNPCIDCHAAMFAVLGVIADQEGFGLVFSGEVLNQRPMSQNRHSLRRVARLSGIGDRLLRPLSARLLEPTPPEVDGLVYRERLLDLSGRSRKRQMEMAAECGIEYDPPAGGCLLTDPGYSTRLRILLKMPGLYTAQNAALATHGRMLVLSDLSVGLVGRDQFDNEALVALSEGKTVMELSDRPGPTGVLLGDDSDAPLLASLVALYGKVDDGAPVRVTSGCGTIVVLPADRKTTEQLLVTF